MRACPGGEKGEGGRQKKRKPARRLEREPAGVGGRAGGGGESYRIVLQRCGADDDRLRAVGLFGVTTRAQRIVVVVQEEQPSTFERQDALDRLKGK